MTPEYSVEANQETKAHAANLIVDRLNCGHQILSDIDGVFYKQTSLYKPDPTTPTILSKLRQLEELGVKIGPATMRGRHVVDSLQRDGLAVAGDQILESGHFLVTDHSLINFAHPMHAHFVEQAIATMGRLKNQRDNWGKVSRTRVDKLFCRGDAQWQGLNRVSWWYNTEEVSDAEVMRDFFMAKLRPLAEQLGLDWDTWIHLSLSSIQNSNLGIIGLRGKWEGKPINKSIAANNIQKPWLFFSDGFEDIEMSHLTQARGGAVIGVGGNVDVSTDIEPFLQGTTVELGSPFELEEVLDLVVKKLT